MVLPRDGHCTSRDAAEGVGACPLAETAHAQWTRAQVNEVLMLDPDAKSAFVLCTDPSTNDKAVVCVNKQPWSEVGYSPPFTYLSHPINFRN